MSLKRARAIYAFSKKYKLGMRFKRRKISRRRVKRSYGRKRRRTGKLSRFNRFRRAAQLKPVTFVTMGLPVKIIKKVNETTAQYCLHLSLLDFRDHTNKDLIEAYQIIYDQFRIKKCTWKFRLTTTQQFVDEGNDSIVSIINAYDPDCATRLLVMPNTIYKMDGYKKRDMKPFTSYKVSLYPKFIDALYSGASGSNTHMSSVRMRTPWLDFAEIATPNRS